MEVSRETVAARQLPGGIILQVQSMMCTSKASFRGVKMAWLSRVLGGLRKYTWYGIFTTIWSKVREYTCGKDKQDFGNLIQSKNCMYYVFKISPWCMEMMPVAMLLVQFISWNVGILFKCKLLGNMSGETWS